MSKIPQDEISTKTVLREAMSQLNSKKEYDPTPCGKPECLFERQKDTWLDSRFLKTAGVIIAAMTPLFAWIVIEIFTLKGDVAVIREKQNAIVEMQASLKEISRDVSQIQIDIATLKAKGNP